jgi:hypothetical protein
VGLEDCALHLEIVSSFFSAPGAHHLLGHNREFGMLPMTGARFGGDDRVCLSSFGFPVSKSSHWGYHPHHPWHFGKTVVCDLEHDQSKSRVGA